MLILVVPSLCSCVSVVWAALTDASNLSLARELNAKLIAMRSDNEATVLRLGPAIQHKLAASIGS
jgi:hypothetical protein